MGATVRTPEIDEAIVQGLSKGTPLTVLCRELGIGLSTVYDWREADEEFAGNIARARDLGHDVIALDALNIIDAAPERVVTVTGEDRSESRIDSASVQWAKNRAELRLKLLAKWDKRYAEKLAHVGGEPGDAPIRQQIEAVVKFVRPGEAQS